MASRISNNGQTTLSSLPMVICHTESRVIRRIGQPPFSCSELIRPAAKLGVNSTTNATCNTTIIPPIVSTPQSNVPAVAA